jgi:hypothetical protein
MLNEKEGLLIFKGRSNVDLVWRPKFRRGN